MNRFVARGAWVTHIFFVTFTVLGGYLAWMLPWVLIPHIFSAAWGARMVRGSAVCPLSRIENWGRARDGQPRMHPDGFITHYFEGRVYPRTWSRRVPLLVATIVLGSWTGVALK